MALDGGMGSTLEIAGWCRCGSSRRPFEQVIVMDTSESSMQFKAFGDRE